MRFFACFGGFVFFAVAATAQTAPDSTIAYDPLARMVKFTNDQYEFGKIPMGQTASYLVGITNIGKDTMVLQNVHAGCGCTTPEFLPNQSFAPGQTIQVKISFNGSVHGEFSRYSTIYFKNGLSKIVTFHGVGMPEMIAPATVGKPSTARVREN